MSHILTYQHCSFFDGLKVLWAYTWTKCCIYSSFLFHKPTTNPLRGNKFWWRLASYTSWFDHKPSLCLWHIIIQLLEETPKLSGQWAKELHSSTKHAHPKFILDSRWFRPNRSQASNSALLILPSSTGFTFYVYSYLVNELGLLFILLQCSYACTILLSVYFW